MTELTGASTVVRFTSVRGFLVDFERVERSIDDRDSFVNAVKILVLTVEVQPTGIGLAAVVGL